MIFDEMHDSPKESLQHTSSTMEVRFEGLAFFFFVLFCYFVILLFFIFYSFFIFLFLLVFYLILLKCKVK